MEKRNERIHNKNMQSNTDELLITLKEEAEHIYKETEELCSIAEKVLKNLEDIRSKKKKLSHIKAKEDIFSNIELEVIIEDRGNFINSIINAYVSPDNNGKKEKLSLEARFLPIVYLLAKGAKNGGFVYNSDLKKVYKDVNEAKSKIVKAFIKIIGSRAKYVIEIEHGIGKRLMIPKRNIIIKKKMPFLIGKEIYNFS